MKSKIFLYSFIGIVMMGPIVSCKNYLDTKPTDFYSTINYYETEAQLQTALNAIYSTMMNPGLFAQVTHFNFTSTTDEMLTNRTQSGDNRGLFYANRLPGHRYVSDIWKFAYIAINHANNLIDNIDKPVMDETNRGYIKGQALFLRAYNYFLLTTNYGEVPLLIHSLGLDETNIPAASIVQVYQQIETDLKEAEILLSGRTVAQLGYNDVVTLTAVQAMLAKVYLYWASPYPMHDQRKYEEAVVYADKVIGAGIHDLNPDYEQVFVNLFQDVYDVRENILEWGSVGAASGVTNKTGNDIGNFVGITAPTWNTIYPNVSFTAVAWVWATRKLFDSYEVLPSSQLVRKASLDIRRDWNCADFSYSYSHVNGVETRLRTPVNNLWQLRTGKFRREYASQEWRAQGTYGTNWPVIRYADVLLIKAEALLMKSSPDEAGAKALLEQVRQRGYGTRYGNIVKDITITDGGTGYLPDAPPVVTISGGGGEGAVATAVVSEDGVVTGIRLLKRGTLTSAGSYYSTAPTVTIAPSPDGSNAMAVATITDGSEHLLDVAKINEMRNSIWWDAYPNEPELMTILRAERMRELCFEASRSYDIARWGRFYNHLEDFRVTALNNGGTGNANGMASLLGVEAKHQLLPKPTYEMNLNRELTQNPGY